MIQVICPVCGALLTTEKPAWRCENGHCFDVARQGYVNLLTVQQKHSLHPGDTAEMVLARRRFLQAGHYFRIRGKLRRMLDRFAPEAQRILDVGCGEGYYLIGVLGQERWGVDISKDAVRHAAARDKTAQFVTATAAHLPFADRSFDALLSMFALTVEEEYARVLDENGIFIQVLAGEKHLQGLKSIIYPSLTEKPKNLQPQLEGFTLLHHEVLEFPVRLEDAQSVQDLLSMTPHLWRISREGAERLARTERLEDRAEVVFNIYSRQNS